MKRQLLVLLLLCLIPILSTGCSDTAPEQPVVDDTETFVGPPSPQKRVDVDLTVLSSTMKYAETINIMTKPDKYLGKTIKISGAYYTSHYEETGRYYHYIIILDEASCCQTGLEFVWSGEHAYPEDFPKELAMIEIVGALNEYDEFGKTYYYLAVDDILIKTEALGNRISNETLFE